MHAAEVEQRVQREQNLERLRTRKYTYDFSRPPEYALAKLSVETTSSSAPSVEPAPVTSTSIAPTTTTATNIAEENKEVEHIGIERNVITLPYGQPIWKIEQEHLAKNVLKPDDIAMRHDNKTLQRCEQRDAQQKLDGMIETVKGRSSIARIDCYREISLNQHAYYYALEPVTDVSGMI
jgi:hypothetical protein